MPHSGECGYPKLISSLPAVAVLVQVITDSRRGTKTSRRHTPMPQAICPGCSFKLDLPPQVSLAKVPCPRCKGALTPAPLLATPAAAASVRTAPASAAPTRPQRPAEPVRGRAYQTKPRHNPRPRFDDRDTD